MSRLLAAHNHLKAQADIDRLASHQRQAYESIINQWRFPTWLNLHGSAGAGKTYLGWVVAESQGAHHLSTPEQLGKAAATIRPGQALVIDNANSDSYVLRQLLATLDLYNIRRVLIITCVSNTNILPTVNLVTPTAEDIELVRRNLKDAGYYSRTSTQHTNLWRIIHSTLV
ncbi:MAG: hypothetical protein H3C69_07925 [Candidatus Promineofilum sp.]|nr:hypothetical protein [Promineifilum sp.]